MPQEDDDPVIATYDVFMAPPPKTSPEASDSHPSSNLYILQYPSHRPSNKPYTSSRSQKPTSFRIKPQTGIFEIDIPLLTTDNYNEPLGTQYGRAMHESTLAHPTTSHGLSGGFSQNTTGSNTSTTPLSLSDVPSHSHQPTTLSTQTLGGKLSTPTDRDPIYMLATLSSTTQRLTLHHLDGLIQMRPQLHHIDAADELKKRADLASKHPAKPDATTNGTSSSLNGAGPAKLETKAIEMKLKDSTKEDPKDRNLNMNATLLRQIQNDPWRKYEWIEKGESEAHGLPTNVEGEGRLKAAFDNDEWLNRMSSPGIELRTRLKGRDRERARRKRQERMRNARAAAGADSSKSVEMVGGGTGEEDFTATASSGESEGESGDEDHDAENAELGPGKSAAQDAKPPVQVRPQSPEVKIKQEAGTATTPKKRGRPTKNAS